MPYGICQSMQCVRMSLAYNIWVRIVFLSYCLLYILSRPALLVRADLIRLFDSQEASRCGAGCLFSEWQGCFRLTKGTSGPACPSLRPRHRWMGPAPTGNLAQGVGPRHARLRLRVAAVPLRALAPEPRQALHGPSDGGSEGTDRLSVSNMHTPNVEHAYLLGTKSAANRRSWVM